MSCTRELFAWLDAAEYRMEELRRQVKRCEAEHASGLLTVTIFGRRVRIEWSTICCPSCAFA